MAEEMKSEVTEVNPTIEEMEIENIEAEDRKEKNGGESEVNGDETALNGKRAREEEDGGVLKKQKGEKSVEEERLEKAKVGEELGQVRLGPKSFGSGEDMFAYFYSFLHFWPPNLDLNKYEHLVLLDLLKRGHPEPDKKTNGKEIRAFQIRFHPLYKSRCFFLIRDDESVDDFSFRKCVNHILPLPEDMKVNLHVNKALRGGQGKGRGGRGGGGGGGRGGWSHGKRR